MATVIYTPNIVLVKPPPVVPVKDVYLVQIKYGKGWKTLSRFSVKEDAIKWSSLLEDNFIVLSQLSNEIVHQQRGSGKSFLSSISSNQHPNSSLGNAGDTSLAPNVADLGNPSKTT